MIAEKGIKPVLSPAGVLLGYRVYVTVGDLFRERTPLFPPDTNVTTMRTWRETTKVELRLVRPASPRGTVAADVAKFLDSATKQLMAGYGAQRSELRAWVKLYGTWSRTAVHEQHIRAARDTWTAAGVAPKTINHRVRSYKQLCEELDGATVPTPCDHVAPLSVPKKLPLTVPESVILRVARNLAPWPLAQARFLILNLTGIRQSQLKRTDPATQLNLREHVWLVASGKHGNHIPVYLTAQMVAAFKRYQALGGFTTWQDNSDYAKLVYAAGWPKTVRPYNARHSVGFALAERGADHQDIADQMGHTNTRTTLEYVRLVKGRLQKNSAKLNQRGLDFTAALRASKRPAAVTVKTGAPKQRLSRKNLDVKLGDAKRTHVYKGKSARPLAS